jgi:hypothetical protein
MQITPMFLQGSWTYSTNYKIQVTIVSYSFNTPLSPLSPSSLSSPSSYSFIFCIGFKFDIFCIVSKFRNSKLNSYCIVSNFDTLIWIFNVSYRNSIWSICTCLRPCGLQESYLVGRFLTLEE